MTALAILALATIHPASHFENSDMITQARLKAHLELIASDLLQGRDTPSTGQDFAALYVSTQLKLWGVRPAGDNGTYFQTIKLSGRNVDLQNSSVKLMGQDLKPGVDFSATSGATEDTGDLKGSLVYVGHGTVFKKQNIDPYAGLDVKGKIVVIAGSTPRISRADRGRFGVDTLRPADAAEKAGAIAVLEVIDDSAGLISGRAERSRRPQRLSPDWKSTGRGIPTITISKETAAKLFAGEQITAEQAAATAGGDPLKIFSFGADKQVELDVKSILQTATTQNVVGIVDGTDPRMKNEYVAFGGHIDHIGMNTSLKGDQIFNGADDDGSGTVSNLEIAHAFAAGARPKRSLLFVWHTGEEKGLWGSDFFTEHPTVPINSIIAQLNMDMIGRSRFPGDTTDANKYLAAVDEVFVVGSGRISSELKQITESVNKNFIGLNYNYWFDRPEDPEQIYTRSDHYNYARKGIPIAFYNDGLHVDYHKVTDEVSRIDFRKMEQVARTVYAVGFTVADHRGPLKIDNLGATKS